MRLVGKFVVALVTAPDLVAAAGGSYAVDDASITPNGRCQLESWARGYRGGAREVVSTPACTLDSVEFSVAVTHNWRDGDSTSPGVKWASGDPGVERWTIGVAAGAVHVGGRWDSEAIYVPLSVALTGDHRWTAHFNAGAEHAAGEGWSTLAGAALDVALTTRWHAIAEVHRGGGGDRTVQAGVRWTLSDAAVVDVVSGRRRSDATERWWTIGLNVGF